MCVCVCLIFVIIFFIFYLILKVKVKIITYLLKRVICAQAISSLSILSEPYALWPAASC